jgi:hypothetical protein
MELHVAENYDHALGCCEVTCSFHLYIICFLMVKWNSHDEYYFHCQLAFVKSMAISCVYFSN